MSASCPRWRAAAPEKSAPITLAARGSEPGKTGAELWTYITGQPPRLLGQPCRDHGQGGAVAGILEADALSMGSVARRYRKGRERPL
jgi:hypothetical protein